MMTRRDILKMPGIALWISLAMAFAIPRLQAQNAGAEVVEINVDPTKSLGRISDNFMGFGYETAAVAQPNYFSPKNMTLIRLYRNLSPQGLIRIGGIISDHAKYDPSGTPVAHTQTEVTVINQANLKDLGAFAQATGWQVMWGLNLGTGSKEEAVTEAQAVNASLSYNLQSFEIGNEVEALQRFDQKYENYHAAYLDYKKAIRADLPHAVFSGPDSIGNLSWITNFAGTESKDMKLLTQHYYRGNAKDTNTTLAKLLAHDAGWDERLEKLRTISHRTGVPFRINEINSFSSGGKPGVSDTFGSALWCLDYMFNLAKYGCDGVNMETDINQLGFVSHYSPIVHDENGRCSARPEYYGMLAFSLAGNGSLLPLKMSKIEANVTAYATKASGGAIWITIINKDFKRDVSVKIPLPGYYAHVSALRLSAPAMESTDQVTLAGTEISPNGSWVPNPAEILTPEAREVSLKLPHASAVLLTLTEP